MRKQGPGGHRQAGGRRWIPDMLVSEMPVGHKQFTEIAREINREKTKHPGARRADRGADRDRGGGAPAGPAQPGPAGHRHHLHLPPPARGRCGRRPHRRAARRQAGEGHPGGRESRCATSRPGWSAARWRAERAGTADDRGSLGAELLSVEHLWVDMPGETVRDVSFAVRGRARSSASAAWPARASWASPTGSWACSPPAGASASGREPVPLDVPAAALEMGMAFVSEDRRGVGLLLDESLDWNIAFTAMQIQGRVPAAAPRGPAQGARRAEHAQR